MPFGQVLAYLVFQHLRFAVPLLSPAKRWSLTPPFHPYHLWGGGLFSVALSVSLAAAFLLGSRLLCVARTFLFAFGKAIRRLTAGKVTKKKIHFF